MTGESNLVIDCIDDGQVSEAEAEQQRPYPLCHPFGMQTGLGSSLALHEPNAILAHGEWLIRGRAMELQVCHVAYALFS